jgi:anti-anti-sigma factor
MGTAVMVFSGEYDLTQKLSVRADLASLLGESEIILDMSEVTYLDSTFVSELMRLRAHRADRNLQTPSIVRTSASVKRLFSLLNLAACFRLADTLDELLAKNGEPVEIHYARSGDDADLFCIPINATESPLHA